MNKTKNAMRNIIFGMGLRIYQIIVPFLMRTAMSGADKEPHHPTSSSGPWCWNTARPKTRPRSGANMKVSSFCTRLRQRPSRTPGSQGCPISAALKAEYRELDKQKASAGTNSTAKSPLHDHLHRYHRLEHPYPDQGDAITPT